jgi:hypothetical protein
LDQVERGEIALRAGLVGGSRQHAYVLVNAHAEVHARAGNTFVVPIESPVFLNRPPLPRIERVLWTASSQRPVTVDIPLKLPENQVAPVSLDGAQIVLRGQIEVLEVRVNHVVPLVPGSSAVGKGERLELLEVDTRDQGVVMKVASSTIGNHHERTRSRWNYHFDFALINRRLEQGWLLTRFEGHGTLSGLVIPGANGWSALSVLTLSSDVSGPLPLDPTWPDGAELARLRWYSLGSYPVTAELNQ